ncbi:M23 family metallopeptidase [Aeromicrobium stalagmiti]|uniref:M23 family metallopeptidase n=1 Tax=Aeromicrobium stalagmiti TaxID=2738988 RepID=UPI001568301C|nr:M23 family metallopeptidase [Aeromicrobium stalagmiti]NRQ49808.1 M23 family metallopeptidase [Aeromicrobium stalagmiti]
MAGAFALILAAFGSAVVGGATDGNTLKADKYQTISQSYSGSAKAAAGDVDISRDFNRTNQIKQTNAQAAQVQAAQQEQKELAANVDKQLKSRQWVLPVTGYNITARFGQRSGLWSTTHTGLDFAGPAGSTIVSIAAGTVKSTGYEGAYGNRTVITLTNGPDAGTDIWYCHQSNIAVSPGDTVGAGDIIGYTGSTGNVTGPHLHLEVHPNGGGPVDPYTALVEHNVTP